jgi:two-component system, response regulator PdtaR
MISAIPKLPTFKVVIAAHELALRQWLTDTLENQGGCRVIGECDSGADMIRTVLALDPNVVVFDVGLPGCSGLDALQQIYKEHPVAGVAVCTERDQELVCKCLETFYLAYLIKPLEPHHLRPAVEVAWSRFDMFRHLAAENATLRQSLQNRKIIERAKGVLMQRNRWSEADAFRRLQRGAMNRRTTMVGLAEAVLSGRHVEL